MVNSKSKSSSSSRDDGKNVHYKGVRMRRWGSWVSEIRAPSQKTRIWLGSYSTQEAAARAYDAALLCHKGSSASFNFPSPLRLHVPPAAHLSTKSIQRLAAAAAANATTTLSPSPTASVASPAISTDTSCNCSTAASPAVLQEECVDSWFDSAFQPHKLCTELMMMMMGGGCGAFFDPQLPLPQAEESCFDEVGDIRLWSF